MFASLETIHVVPRGRLDKIRDAHQNHDAGSCSQAPFYPS